MVLLNDSVVSKMMDVRLIERNIARGVVTPDQVQKELSQLPDDSENAEWVQIDSLLDDHSDSDSTQKSASQAH